jgi:hypothetical protein
MSEVILEEKTVSIGIGEASADAASADGSPSLVGLLTRGEPEKAIGQVINRLINDREDWEKSELVRSNDKLYEILQSCYALHNTMVGSDALAKSLRKGLANYIESKNYLFTNSTPLMTKVVKCVFGVDRRRVHAYATALLAAKDSRVSVIEITKWLRDQGGVEEVRRASKASTNTVQARVSEGKVVLQAAVLAVVQSDKLNAQFSNEKLSEGVVLLATRADNGSFEIRRVIQTDSVVKAAIASCSAVGKTEKKKLELEAQARATEQARIEAQKQLKVG